MCMYVCMCVCVCVCVFVCVCVCNSEVFVHLTPFLKNDTSYKYNVNTEINK